MLGSKEDLCYTMSYVMSKNLCICMTYLAALLHKMYPVYDLTFSFAVIQISFVSMTLLFLIDLCSLLLVCLNISSAIIVRK